MKKALALFLSLALLCGVLVFPANAAEVSYYETFQQQYFDGKDPLLQDLEAPYFYRELYTHQTNGAPDWVLIHADAGDHCEVETQDVFFGRYFYQCDVAYPFVYTYGIYDIARQRFFDLCEIEDESRYPGLQEVFDTFGVGKKLGAEPLFKDEFYRYASWNQDGSDIEYYRELAYHFNANGELSWVLAEGATNMEQPVECYEIIGDRVFRDWNYHVPFGLNYGIYDVEKHKFYDILNVWQQYKGVLDDMERLNLGEKIGDVDSDGRLSVKDVTEIQRRLAEISETPENDGVEAGGYWHISQTEGIAYLSDVNRNNARDIGDATQVQLALAELF